MLRGMPEAHDACCKIRSLVSSPSILRLCRSGHAAAGLLSILTLNPKELISPFGRIAGCFQRGSSTLAATQTLPVACCAVAQWEIARTSATTTKVIFTTPPMSFLGVRLAGSWREIAITLIEGFWVKSRYENVTQQQLPGEDGRPQLLPRSSRRPQITDPRWWSSTHAGLSAIRQQI
jgi:hypothetical protein